MNICFKGKRALVTGAGQVKYAPSIRVGYGIAIELAQCGAKVLAVDISKDLLTKLKYEVPSIEIVEVDLTDWNKTCGVLKKLLPVDLLVNNAGVQSTAPLTSVTEEDYNKMFNVNVKALINVTRNVTEHMIEYRINGAIVNISSQGSTAGFINHTVYCASKGAVDAFTRAAAVELAPNNIRVNCVTPTVVLTDSTGKASRTSGHTLARIPLNKFPEVADAVHAALFLLSDYAKMITGSCFPVDGGFSAC